jgi:hypothetical protein
MRLKSQPQDMAFEYKLREFTVEEYHRMAEAGVLRDDERVELLDGAIVEMSPIGRVIGTGTRASYATSTSRSRTSGFSLRARTPDAAPSPTKSTPSSSWRIRRCARTPGRSCASTRASRSRTISSSIYDEPHELGYRRERRIAESETFTLHRIPGVTLAAAPFLSR